jgi:plasmid stabilization system protein ParE
VLRIRPLAAVDLEEIVRYLDSQSITAADHFLEEFYMSAERLAARVSLGISA